MFPGGRKAEDGRIDDRYNLAEFTSSSYPARTRRNIEESGATVLFSLERLLRGGSKLIQDSANNLGKPALHMYDNRKERIFNPDSLRLAIQALTDFLCSNNIEILNVVGPRESKEPGVYERTLILLRFFLSGGFRPGSTEGMDTLAGASRVGEGSGGLATELLNQPLFFI
jgi:hypothetical protein